MFLLLVFDVDRQFGYFMEARDDLQILNNNSAKLFLNMSEIKTKDCFLLFTILS